MTTVSTALILRALYKDFPSQDPTVRLVILLTIFLSDTHSVPAVIKTTSKESPALARYIDACSDLIDEMNLGPLTRKDITDVLLSKFVPDRFGGILEYARSVMELDGNEIHTIVTDVALGCLEIGCKGKMLAKLVEGYDDLSDIIAVHIVKKYRIQLDDLPPLEDEKACKDFSAPMCADFMMRRGVPLTFEETTAPPSPPPVEPPVLMQVDEPAAPPAEDGENAANAAGGESEDEEAAEEPEAPSETEEDLVRTCQK